MEHGYLPNINKLYLKKYIIIKKNFIRPLEVDRVTLELVENLRNEKPYRTLPLKSMTSNENTSEIIQKENEYFFFKI